MVPFFLFNITSKGASGLFSIPSPIYREIRSLMKTGTWGLFCRNLLLHHCYIEDKILQCPWDPTSFFRFSNVTEKIYFSNSTCNKQLNNIWSSYVVTESLDCVLRSSFIETNSFDWITPGDKLPRSLEYSLRVTQISTSIQGLSWGIILSGVLYLNDRCSDQGLFSSIKYKR